MRKMFFCVILFLLSRSLGFSCNQRVDYDSINFVSENIYKILKDSLSQFELPNNMVFNESWNEYSVSKYPYICKSDFNGDEVLDFVFILASKNHKELLVCVFLSNKKTYNIFRIKQFTLDEKEIPLVLNIENKGVWESPNGKKHIKNNGFVIYWVTESKSYIYYWNKNKFDRFCTD